MKPLKERIRDALASGPRLYHAVLYEVFPSEQFPRAFRSPTKGGPPGCAFAFGRALREMGVYEQRGRLAGRGNLSLPS
jgi:hypothetical protein